MPLQNEGHIAGLDPKCPFGSAGRAATGSSSPQQPRAVVVDFESDHADKPKAPHLARYGAFGSRVSGRSRTHRDSTSVFALSKNKNIDISMFLIGRFLQKMPFLAV